MIYYTKFAIMALLLIILTGLGACKKVEKWGERIPVMSSCNRVDTGFLLKNSRGGPDTTEIALFNQSGVILYFEDIPDEKIHLLWEDIKAVYLFKSPKVGTFMSVINKMEKSYPITYFDQDCEQFIDEILPDNLQVVRY